MAERLRRAFDDFAARKTEEAAAAVIAPLSTIVDRADSRYVWHIGNAWSRSHYGGDFGILAAPKPTTQISLVFVQSKDGNTGGDPGALGAGSTDQHLIYEGLSRVAASAVLAGAGSIYATSFFSVWHPELVALRAALGLPRHPAQIVVSRRGRVDLDALLFNVPDVPVFLIMGRDGLSTHAASLRARPWIRPILPIDDDLRTAIDGLYREHGILRISAIGGRATATQLVDAGLAQDIYLTTTPHLGGETGTPWYCGTRALRLTTITEKRWIESAAPVVFEHILID